MRRGVWGDSAVGIGPAVQTRESPEPLESLTLQHISVIPDVLWGDGRTYNLQPASQSTVQ